MFIPAIGTLTAAAAAANAAANHQWITAFWATTAGLWALAALIKAYGDKRWGPKWSDTSEGIERELRRR